MAENENKTEVQGGTAVEENSRQRKMKTLALDLVEMGNDEDNRAADLKVNKKLPLKSSNRLNGSFKSTRQNVYICPYYLS